MKPRLLDTFCKAGGSAMGYCWAGFEVTGIDIEAQPRYPFTFIQADALEYISDHGHEYDVINASPPCQEYSRTKSLHKSITYPDLLGPVRTLLQASGKPWVIENVVGAPFEHWISLCGAQFGLRTYRHRRFESSHLMFQPEHPRHVEKVLDRGYDSNWSGFYCVTGGGNAPLAAMKAAMQIDWMLRRELTQAIPPAYTEFIGKQLMAALA